MFALIEATNEIQKKFDKCKKQLRDFKARIQEWKETRDHVLLKNLSNELYNKNKLYELPTPTLDTTLSLHAHAGKVYSLCWNPKTGIAGERLLTASNDGYLHVWNIETKKKELVIPLSAPGVMACTYSPSGNHAASAGMDNTVSIFDIGSFIGWEIKNPSTELKGHEGYISSIKYIDQHYLLSSSGDSTVKLWDIEKQACLTTHKNHDGEIECLDVNTERSLYVSGSVDTTINAQDYRMADGTGKHERFMAKFHGHESDINCIKWFPDKDAFVSGSDDSTLRLWDTKCMQQLNRYEDENHINRTSSVTSVDCSKSGYYIIAGYDENPHCVLWKTALAEVEQKLHHSHRVPCVQVSPNGKYIATGCCDQIVRLWGEAAKITKYNRK